MGWNPWAGPQLKPRPIAAVAPEEPSTRRFDRAHMNHRSDRIAIPIRLALGSWSTTIWPVCAELGVVSANFGRFRPNRDVGRVDHIRTISAPVLGQFGGQLMCL